MASRRPPETSKEEEKKELILQNVADRMKRRQKEFEETLRQLKGNPKQEKR